MHKKKNYTNNKGNDPFSLKNEEKDSESKIRCGTPAINFIVTIIFHV